MSNKIKNFKEKHPNVFTGICVGGAVIATAVITRTVSLGLLTKEKVLVPSDCNLYRMPLPKFIPLAAAKSCIKGIREGELHDGSGTLLGYCDVGDCLPDGVTEITLGGLKEAIDEIVAEGYANDGSKIDVAMVSWFKD